MRGSRRERLEEAVWQARAGLDPLLLGSGLVVVDRHVAVPLDAPLVEASLTAHARVHHSGPIGNGTNAESQADACRTRWATTLESGAHGELFTAAYPRRDAPPTGLIAGGGLQVAREAVDGLSPFVRADSAHQGELYASGRAGDRQDTMGNAAIVPAEGTHAFGGGVNLSHEACLNFGEKRARVTARVARGSGK